MNVLQKADSSAVSTPSTPNSSSLSSQSNLVGTTTPLSTPSPATPTQQSNNIPIAPPTPANSLTHKNSLKGTKLARRARSFKDDLFEKISLMRTPNNTLGRSNSPHSPRTKNASMKPPPTIEDFAKSTQSLETHVKDICNALKHFRDVILKKKLEVLPGNGTVILETSASLLAVIQSYALNENGAVLLSATQQVYQSLGKLIKLCDEVMLSEESNEWASLSNDNVRTVVDLLEDAVKNLVMLAQQKLKEKEECAFKYGPSAADMANASHSQNHLMRPPVEVAGQRTSLPDITLTPKERDILEKTKSVPIRASHSTESILRDSNPPAKPPLPNRTSNPPPLPPKRRSQQQLQNSQFNSNNISINSDLDCSSDFSFMNYGVDHLSVRSRSPDENSSQCSLESALNHSREEEELKALGLENRFEDHLLEDDIEKMVAIKNQKGVSGTDDVNKANTKTITKNGGGMGDSAVGAGAAAAAVAGINNCSKSLSSIAAGIQNVASASVMTAKGVTSSFTADSPDHVDNAELRQTAATTNHRHSNESGFVSMKSFRASTQSVSKRSSDYSFQSSNKSSSSEMAFNAHECSRHQIVTATNSFNSTTTTSTASSSFTEQQISSTKVYTTSNSNIMLNDNDTAVLLSCTSPEQQGIVERQQQSYSSLTNTNSLDASLSDYFASTEHIEPPTLPPKTSKNKDRFHSQYNNFDELDDVNSISDVAELRQHHHYQQHQQQHQIFHLQSKHQSLLEPRRAGGMAGSCVTIAGDNNLEEPPPLPIKKKHILAYMEICSASTRSMEHRHTMHTFNVNRNITHSQTMNIVPQAKELSPDNEIPPALPPKSYKQRKPTSMPPTIITTPPPSPKPNNLSALDQYSNEGGILRHPRILSGNQSNEPMSTLCEEIDDEKGLTHHSHKLPNVDNIVHTKAITPELINDDEQDIDGVLDKHNYHNNNNNNNNNNDDDDNDNEKLDNKSNTSKSNSPDNLPNLLEEIDITPYLVLKKDGEDGPEVKGGYIDALIVHASRVQKVSDNAFSEAFITTFRTFIQPIDVIEKLTHRYTVFFCQLNDQKKRAAKETFSLLVRVVNDLTSADLTDQLLSLLMEFNYQLVCSGELYLAKVLRNKFVEKVTIAKEQKMPIYQPDMYSTITNQPSLLDLKSVEIAEQMTLLDAELFQKIEIPEVLLFAKEQCEEKSPNLNKFTEHFNKMSYWARSKILRLADAKDREKHVFKFIKIMKHLRKMNNYNSYLALLSALDSAPIRRLEWQKTITEGLKEYCTLIDSSSSFRVYRQALAETAPPCIPYIGLVLQDLTFVHVGNPDYLKDGVINFSKRWQQYNIIVNMKRFKKCAYPFRRNERIIRFFENFENFLDEEQMWQISESIKPRPKRTVQY